MLLTSTTQSLIPCVLTIAGSDSGGSWYTSRYKNHFSDGQLRKLSDHSHHRAKHDGRECRISDPYRGGCRAA